MEEGNQEQIIFIAVVAQSFNVVLALCNINANSSVPLFCFVEK